MTWLTFPDPAGNPADLAEDLAQYTRDDGSVVDVGWYPDSDPSGEFVCRVVDADSPEAWVQPIEELHTRDPAEVARWYAEKLKACGK